MRIICIKASDQLSFLTRQWEPRPETVARQCTNKQKTTPGSRPAAIRSEDLFRGRKQLEIVHNGVVYCLRITANDKLILTK